MTKQTTMSGDLQKRALITKCLLGFSVIGFGILVIVIPWILFPVCGVGQYIGGGNEPYGRHGCHDTLYVETGLGVIAIILGSASVIFQTRRVILATSAVTFLLAGFVLLFPLAITGVCRAPTMPCRLGTVPALVMAGTILGMIAVIQFLFVKKKF